MRWKSLFLLVLTLAVAGSFDGCKSHETKVADLQKQYDELGAKFQKDCSGEMLNLPQKLSPKCSDEKKTLADTWNRLQAERLAQK